MTKYLLIFALAIPCFGQGTIARQIWALNQIENGSNVRRGNNGEIGSTAIMPYRLAECGIPIPARIDPQWVSNATATVLMRSCTHFNRIYHRWPTDYEVGLLWHCPSAIQHPNKEQKDFAQRFENLVKGIK
jgi:hypothetical protein